MNAATQITLAAARYSSHGAAVNGFDMVWDAHKGGEFDHTAVAVLTKDESGKLQVERHDTTAKHLAWVGAALTVVAPVTAVGVLSPAPGPERSSVTSTTTSRRKMSRPSVSCSSPVSRVCQRRSNSLAGLV